MADLSVPERNRAIKTLLIRTYGKEAGISVRAGRGTAYHWIEIKIAVSPASLRVSYGEACAKLVNQIRANGLHVSTYSSDGDFTGDCLSLTLGDHRR